MLKDPTVVKAARAVQLRAEMSDPAILERLFVDTGAVGELENPNNQILYGRRGTGKTHVFRILSARVSDPDVSVYIDCRMLGSGGQVSEDAHPGAKAQALFRDLMSLLQAELLNVITELPNGDAAFDVLGALNEELHAQEYRSGGERSVEEQGRSGRTVSAAISQSGARAEYEQGKEERFRTIELEVLNEWLHFGNIRAHLIKILDLCGIETLHIFVDEWSEIPVESQPFLAEFMKRTFFADSRVRVKIAALEHRSQFNGQGARGTIGLELGGDIFATSDLDDYCIVDQNPDQVGALFAQLLFRHLDQNVPDGYFNEVGLRIDNLPSKLFTQAPAFQELMRASEGVPRDFLNIFTLAFQNARQRERETIDIESVRGSAAKWYERDKRQNLSGLQTDTLNRIITEVIGTRRSRHFMLEQRYAEHPVIRQLHDQRVLHRVREGYSSRDDPGVRYDIYALDYGTYIGLKNTSAELQMGFDQVTEAELEQRAGEIDVPFDDHRSIRRIILDPSLLGETTG